MKHGLTHLYTGEGKGKTTSALGLTLRAAGHGLRIGIFQFCKNTPSGELTALKQFPKVSVQRADEVSNKFSWEMTTEEKEGWCDAQRALYDDACDAATCGQYDMVVMDEALGAVHGGALDEKQLLYLISHKSRSTELIITGRAGGKALIEACDYVTEMRCIRHPMDKGEHARRGVEY